MHQLNYFAEIMIKIRIVEETLLDLFAKGEIHGTTHTYIGQEASGVGVISCLNRDKDYVISNHRNHGHYLSFGGDITSFFAELTGREGALVGGLGGSQHLHFGRFFSNGILGGVVPIACGIALGSKLDDNGAVIVIFIGDGTLGEGVLYESFNLASLWELPILFVLENNGIAQTNSLDDHCANNIPDRPRAFGIKTTNITTNNVEEVYLHSNNIISEIRDSSICQVLIINQHRMGPHSKGDDTRDEESLKQISKEDPLHLLQNKLGENYLAIYNKIKLTIDNSINEVLARPPLDVLP